MPEVKSAREATHVALSFIRKHRSFARPLKAFREGDIWFVEIDVGTFLTAIAKVEVDAKSAEILKYTIPG
jgi:hypothetical protein